MEPRILEIVSPPAKTQRKHRMIAATIQAVLWTMLMFFWTYFTRHKVSDSKDWIALLLSAAFGGIVFGVLMYFFSPLLKFFPRGKGLPARASILVDDDQLTLQYRSSGSQSWTPKKVVRRGMIRSIFEIPGGLAVSERSQFGARMLGCLAIPNSLPEFNELKSLLESWRVSKTNIALHED